MLSFGKLFLGAVVRDKSVSALLAFGQIDDLFKANEVEAYSFVKNFVKQYGAVPSADTIEQHTNEQVASPDQCPEPPGYYMDLMIQRYTETLVKKTMTEANKYLQVGSKDPAEALRILMDGCMQASGRSQQHRVHDFRQAYSLVMADYISKYTTETARGLMLGWPTFDGMTGGLVKGDKMSFVGRPAQGKTWQLLYAAHHGWNRHNLQSIANQSQSAESRLFVSMEMMHLPIEQRLASMQASVPMDLLKKAELSTVHLNKLKKGLTEIQGYEAPFWVVDGNLAATVEDIWMLARQLKPDAIFIDGGYLLKHPTERDRFRRVAENADLIKSELAALCPTVVSYQFSKQGAKKNKKKGEKADLEDIGYTDAIAQNSSIVAGIMQPESVETINHRIIELLKGRNGEVGQWLTNWDFFAMDFSEKEPEDPAELQFV